MNDRQLTISEALDAFPKNPEAASLALGMVLLQSSRDQCDRITKSIEESQEKRIAELEDELDYWRPLGKKWLALKNILADDDYERLA